MRFAASHHAERDEYVPITLRVTLKRQTGDDFRYYYHARIVNIRTAD